MTYSQELWYKDTVYSGLDSILVSLNCPSIKVKGFITVLGGDVYPNNLTQLHIKFYVGEVRFELTLNVTSSLNGSQHLCVVTVNHDGTLNQTYPGGIVTLRTTRMKLHVIGQN